MKPMSRKCGIVREAAGLMDISTLGKIDVQGPDAAIFLDQVYANGFAKLPVGRARYGVMLRDDGIVFDDGTTTRLVRNAILHDHLDGQGGRRALAAGIPARHRLAGVCASRSRRSATNGQRCRSPDRTAGISLPLPFPASTSRTRRCRIWAALESEFEGRPLRILRLSYSGERAYEVYVGATAGAAAWTRLLDAGAQFGLAPYGVEALGALRVEKGHVAGPEIDGRTTLDDLGLGRMVGKRTGFVGDVLRHRPAFCEANRQRLVGLECIDSGTRLRGGALLFLPGDKPAGHGRGRVTSITYSPELGRYVGLGPAGRRCRSRRRARCWRSIR